MRPRLRAAVGRRVAAVAPDARVWWLTGVLGLAAGVLHVELLAGLPEVADGLHVPWLLLALSFAVAEAAVAHLRVGTGRDTVSVSVSEVFLVLGLFVVSPTEVVLAAVLGMGMARFARRRTPLIKVAFNLAQRWLGVVVAVGMWRLLVDVADVHTPRAALAAVAAAVVFDLLSALSVAAVVALHTGSTRGTRPRALRAGFLSATGMASFALLALHVLRHEPRAVWMVVVLAGFLLLSQRAHLTLLRRHDTFASLQAFAARVADSDLRLDAVVREVLLGVRDLLDADGVQLVLLGPDEGSGHAWSCDADGLHVHLRGHVPAQEQDGATLTVVLKGPTGPIALLTVTDRLLGARAHRNRDRLLLDTLAAHAAVALQNARLADRLRGQVEENEHQALHDSLTGLPNRVRFEREAEVAAASGRLASVLLFDLDRFKDVNDTLGHAAGDAVLREVGHRLAACLRDAVCVARLGGDEFAVLLSEPGREAAFRTAHSIRSVLTRPYELDGLSLALDASIGIALAPEHGDDVPTLLRHADVAMYTAKTTQTGAATYNPLRDHHTAERLTLVADLRRGIAEGQLLLAYQPKTGTTDRRVLGVEALVRWQHPVRGVVAPDEFIGVAERSGLIGALTDWVVEAALAQCRQWMDDGLDLGVSINISPRTLHDASFPARMAQQLACAGVSASRITLEITEGALMIDPERALEVLQVLRRSGLRLSVDDLGVGHSSLAYLKRLPVQEIKIDRSFVTGLADDPDDHAIVGALVQMVHRLGMTVVAEGVEDQRTLDALALLGADEAQGYWMSRPLPAAQVPQWCRSWSDGSASAPVLVPDQPVPPGRRPEEAAAASLLPWLSTRSSST
jgi:diguanylate cyclase (GGDEF)-like protein